jgi:hypothetical protein
MRHAILFPARRPPVDPGRHAMLDAASPYPTDDRTPGRSRRTDFWRLRHRPQPCPARHRVGGPGRLCISQDKVPGLERQRADPSLQGVLRMRVRADGQITPLALEFRPRPEPVPRDWPGLMMHPWAPAAIQSRYCRPLTW